MFRNRSVKSSQTKPEDQLLVYIYYEYEYHIQRCVEGTERSELSYV